MGDTRREAIRTGLRVAVLASLGGLCYATTIRGMALQWWTDEDMGHGFVVPAAIGWVIWNERRRWRSTPVQPSWWGVALLVLGAALHGASGFGAGLFAGSLALLVSTAGAILCLAGLPRLRAWAFPLMLALFMLPKLAILYNQVTLPLQLTASRLAAAILTITGAGVIREGNVLDVGGHRVAVAEACDGIRYLLSLGFLGVMMAYVLDRTPWMRMAMLALAVPVAIAANAIRVAASASLPALDSGLPHAAAGFAIFLACLAALLSGRWLLRAVTVRMHA